MATAVATLPRPRRRPRNQPAGGRATVPEVYFVKSIDNSRLHREVDREERGQCFALLGLLVFVFFLGFLYAWQHFECVRYGYQTEQLKERRAALEEWNRQLRLEQASLEDPQRIDTLARQELGLTAPDPRQVVQVEGGPGVPVQAADPVLARNAPALASTLGGLARNPE